MISLFSKSQSYSIFAVTSGRHEESEAFQGCIFYNGLWVTVYAAAYLVVYRCGSLRSSTSKSSQNFSHPATNFCLWSVHEIHSVMFFESVQD